MGSYATPADFQSLARGSMGDFMQNQNLAAETALRQQQTDLANQTIQAQALQNQQLRLDMSDQQTLRQALLEDPANASKIYTGDQQYLSSLGLQPKTVFDLVGKYQEYRKNLLANTAEQNKIQADATGTIADGFYGLQQMKDEQGNLDLDRVNSEGPNLIQRLQQQNKFAQAGVGTPQWQNITDPAQLDQMVAHTIGMKALHDKVVAEQEAQGKATKESAEGKIKQYEADQLNATPDQIAARLNTLVPPDKFPTINKNLAIEYQAAPTLEAKNAVLDKYGKMMTDLSPEAQTAKSRQSFENARQSALGTASTMDPSSFADAVANYQVRLGDVMTRMPGVSRQEILKAVLAKNPQFQESNYDVAKKTEEGFTSGKQADLVRANNNALEHLGLLEAAGRALNNNDLPLLNRIGNELGFQTGSSAPAMYDLIAKKVGDETTKAFIPGGGGQGERAAGAEDFSRNLNDAQRTANIRAAVKLMDSQQKNLQDQYKRGTYGAGKQQLYTDEAMQTRNRLLGNPGQFSVKAPNGKIYNFQTQGEADNFKKAAGIP
jgi:hypothetical protein